MHRWLEGDPAGPPPPEQRKRGRNHEWWHFAAGDVLSMPDKWEYPWFAAWDMAFHCVAFAMIDPDFAKEQLLLLTREWYMHPNGQIPAYEWAFGDVNPPVHAWAAIRVYQIEEKMYGRRDRAFLERVFQKLLINFTWWVNRKDAEGNNIFEGGFLGLDNIGAFDRTSGLPVGGRLEQADGTSWMAMYCLNLLGIALELAQRGPGLRGRRDQVLRALRLHRRGRQPRRRPRGRPVARARTATTSTCCKLPGRRAASRSRRYTIAGLIPLFAIAVGDRDSLRGFRDFARALRAGSPSTAPSCSAASPTSRTAASSERIRLALVDSHKLARILDARARRGRPAGPARRALGVEAACRELRSCSRSTASASCSTTSRANRRRALFGGNSNWRGPVWFPLNFLLIEALQKHHYFLGDEFKVDVPDRLGQASARCGR